MKKGEREREGGQEIAPIIAPPDTFLFAGENFAHSKIARENARKRLALGQGIPSAIDSGMAGYVTSISSAATKAPIVCEVTHLRPIDRVPGTPKHVRHFYRGGHRAAIFSGAPSARLHRRHRREGTKLPVMRLCASFDRQGTRDRDPTSANDRSFKQPTARRCSKRVIAHPLDNRFHFFFI